MGEEGGGLLLWREGDGVDESAEFRGADLFFRNLGRDLVNITHMQDFKDLRANKHPSKYFFCRIAHSPKHSHQHMNISVLCNGSAWS